MTIQKILQIQKSLVNQPNINSLFKIVLRILPQLGAEFGSILLKTKDESIYFQSTLFVQQKQSKQTPYQLAQQLIEHGLEGYVMQHKQIHRIADVSKETRWHKPNFPHQPCKSAIMMPLVLAKIKATGVLVLGHTQVNAFAQADLTLLEIITLQITQAIENLLLYRQQLDRTTQIDLINEVGQVATSILNVNLMLTIVSQAIQRSFKFYSVGIGLIPSEKIPEKTLKKTLNLVAFTGADGRSLPPEEIPIIANPLTALVVKNKQPLIINNVKTNIHYSKQIINPAIKSKLIIPIKLGIKVIGALDMESITTATFNPPLVAALKILSDQLAVAIENAHLYQELAQRITQVETLRAFNQNVIENITTGLIALDTKGIITVFNKAVAALLGVASVDSIGQQLTEVLPTIPQLTIPFSTTLKTQQAITHRDMTIEHWDGGILTITLTTTPMYNTENQLIGVVGLIEDLTELKALEAKRRHFDRLATLGEMSAVVAHELRNPIAGIAAGVSYLAKKMKADATEYQASQMILKEVDRVHRIIEDILLVARPLSLQVEDHYLVEIIENIAQRYQQTLNENAIKLVLDMFPNLPFLTIDRARIEQVLNNLTENAIQAMPHGGKFTISTSAPNNEHVNILVSDTGQGIPDEHISKIFDPFFTTKNRGTGLGLALSHRIIEAHQGNIQLLTSNENGTTFKITLPLNN